MGTKHSSYVHVQHIRACSSTLTDTTGPSRGGSAPCSPRLIPRIARLVRHLAEPRDPLGPQVVSHRQEHLLPHRRHPLVDEP
jgi:alanyl-tRNA synthetase